MVSLNAAMDGQQNDATYDLSVPVQPVVSAAWRGRFSIPSKNININVAAHVSNKACMEVLKVANIMPDSLCLEMFSRLDVWPASFKSSPPTEHSIALFFFPMGRDEEVLDSLISEAIYSDFALKAMIGRAELLIFTSLQLPKKLHRFVGKLYLWGVFRERQSVSSHQSDYHVCIENSKVRQSSYSNSGNHRSFEGVCPISISSKHSPLTHAAKSDKRGRHLDDAWEHAKPLDELRQKAECRYCGFVSSHGGISRLKAHLGGGNPKIHLPGCQKVSPEVKKVMADWFGEWAKSAKALWAKGLRAEPEAYIDERGRPHDFAWEHAKSLDISGKQKTESKYISFVSLDGGLSHHKVQLGVRDQKMHMDTWSTVSPEIKSVTSERLTNTKSSRPQEMKGVMSDGANILMASKMKNSGAADVQSERRGRPLDDAWQHAKSLDVARQKTQCNYCGFVSSYGGISRLKAHLGGGCPQMQLQGCPQVSLEVKRVMEQWFNEWAKNSSAAWTRKSNEPRIVCQILYTLEIAAPAVSCKRGRPLDDMWEHAMPLDEHRQTTKCKYCGFVSKYGGIARLKAHLSGGDPTTRLEGCTNVPVGVRSSMTEDMKKCRKKSKGVLMESAEVSQASERTGSNTRWDEKRHHILQETMDEVSNTSLKGSLQKLIYEKNAKVQKMQYGIQSLENHFASMPRHL